MADGSKIEWTDATWNVITGCTVLTPGCTNCYAMRLAGTRLRHHPSRVGLTVQTKAGPVWNGQVRFNEQWLGQSICRSLPLARAARCLSVAPSATNSAGVPVASVLCRFDSDVRF